MLYIDWSYLYSLVAFVIGGLAGFQGVYEKYNRDSIKASTTFPGFFYLLSRAAFPTAVFAGSYGFGLIKSYLLLAALACGTGAELFLRTKVFIKQGPTSQGSVEDLLKGPLDLLRWYQNLFLDAAASGLAERRKNFIKKNLPREDAFQALHDRFLKNMDAWPNPAVMTKLKVEVDKLKTEVDAKNVQSGSDLDQKYKFKLGYLVYNEVGSKGFKTLLSS